MVDSKSIPDDFFLGAPSPAAHRNEFRSVHELIDQAKFSFDLRGWPEASIESFQRGLEQFARNVVSQAHSALRAGCMRGLEQTEDLLMDPEYYRVTKKKNQAARKKNREANRQRNAEQEKAMYSPSTPEQIAAARRRLIQMKDYHQEALQRYTLELVEFEKKAGASLDLAKVHVGEVRQ